MRSETLSAILPALSAFPLKGVLSARASGGGRDRRQTAAQLVAQVLAPIGAGGYFREILIAGENGAAWPASSWRPRPQPRRGAGGPVGFSVGDQFSPAAGHFSPAEPTAARLGQLPPGGQLVIGPNPRPAAGDQVRAGVGFRVGNSISIGGQAARAAALRRQGEG